jgi:hypothetical protein
MAGKKPENPAETAQPSDPTRCGGYVLTDQGWVLDPHEPDAKAEEKD